MTTPKRAFEIANRIQQATFLRTSVPDDRQIHAKFATGVQREYKLGTCGSAPVFPFEILMCQKYFFFEIEAPDFLACMWKDELCIQGLCDAIDSIGDG